MKRLLVALAAVISVSALGDDPVELFEKSPFLGPPSNLIAFDRFHLTNHSTVPQKVVVTLNQVAHYPATLGPLQQRDLDVFWPDFEDRFVQFHAEPVDGRGPTTDTRFLVAKAGAQELGKYLFVTAPGISFEIPDNASSVRPPGSKTPAEVETYRCTAKSAPDRPSAYFAFHEVVIAPGAPRLLTDPAVSALEDYVLLGGHLVLPAGLDDRRWDAFRFKHVGIGCAGLGSIAYLPMQGPRIASIGQKPVLQAVYDAAPHSLQLNWLRAFPDETNEQLAFASGPTSTSLRDPFSLKLPPFSYVATVVVLYFLLVVPLNFLVLNRMRRPELAWITGPAFAVIFAAILLKGSQALYTAKASTATQGTLLLQEGMPEGLFRGTSDLYTPTAGVVDLGLHDVDILKKDYTMPEGSVDTGTVTVPALPVHNLQFQRLGFIQRMNVAGWFHFEAVHGAGPVFRVTNHSPYTVHQAILTYGDHWTLDKELAPGQTELLQANGPHSERGFLHDPNQNLQVSDLPHYRGGLLLTGVIDALPVGCHVGQPVPSHSSFSLAAFPPPDLTGTPPHDNGH